MADFTLVDPRGWEYDLHSVYSSYLGYFQVHSIPWYDRTWGHLFSSFEEFLAFSWPVITVTDAFTGKAHIVTRLTSIGAFLKMIKTRFGETLPQAPNMMKISPFETTTRHLRNISDYPSYKKLHATLPAAVLSALKGRIRAGEPKAISDLWNKRDHTFLAMDFEWSERNEKSCLEWGFAAVRCGHLEASGHWPPIPDNNYRKGHYIVEEYVDKLTNRHTPNHPWQFAFGDSQVISKTKLPQIVQATISGLASPDSETAINTLVLVVHETNADLARIEEMKIKIPHNMLIIDMLQFERSLYTSGQRGILLDLVTDRPRQNNTTISLDQLLISFARVPLSSPSGSNPRPPIMLPQIALHNAGNDAFMALFAFQMLLDPNDTQVPVVKKGRIGRPGNLLLGPTSGMPMMNMGPPSPMNFPGLMAPGQMMRSSSAYDLASEFGQMHRGMSRAHSGGPFFTSPSRITSKYMGTQSGNTADNAYR